jgi:hypothetical protein
MLGGLAGRSAKVERWEYFLTVNLPFKRGTSMRISYRSGALISHRGNVVTMRIRFTVGNLSDQ